MPKVTGLWAGSRPRGAGRIWLAALLSRCAFGVAFSVGLGGGGGLTLAQDDVHVHPGHEHGGATVSMADLTAEQRKRVRRLQDEVMCDCPRENYSRTLANCPDTCANAQKEIIRGMVREDRPDAEIFRRMLERVQSDQRVLSSPRSAFGRWVYVLPFAVLGISLLAAAFVVQRWGRRGREERERRNPLAVLVTDEERGAIERELSELD